MIAKGFEEISPQRKYHGISAQIIAQIKNVRVPFNVDIGVGDIIVPKAEQRVKSSLHSFQISENLIQTYSLESTIAEKFDAILQFELTGRMKISTDIFYLAGTFDLTERGASRYL